MIGNITVWDHWDPVNISDSVEAAREAAGNDMVALMTKVYPIIANLTSQAIIPLGYAADGSGTWYCSV